MRRYLLAAASVLAIAANPESPSPDLPKRLLADNGFFLVDHRLRDPDCGDATVWLARAA